MKSCGDGMHDFALYCLAIYFLEEAPL